MKINKWKFPFFKTDDGGGLEMLGYQYFIKVFYLF